MYSEVEESSEQACKRKFTGASKKKTVSFSDDAKLRRVFTNDSNLHADSSWLTDDEVFSMNKRAKNLATLHYLKTRPGQKAPSKHSGIVYNCHPAHYEIIGESLRGMEHITDISKTQSRKRLRSGVNSLMEEHQNQDNTCGGSKLACKFIECTKEAMAYSIQMAEEDARTAAAILTEDLKQHDDVVSISSESSAAAMSSPCPCSSITDFPRISRMSSSPAAA
mmetsp:Transcript_29938/g.51126  ORF Transcript_29938/g.51126 Transcript_29938/m.51126 type:complete len:222 (+) Transcript_29938:120-785(+)